MVNKVPEGWFFPFKMRSYWKRKKEKALTFRANLYKLERLERWFWNYVKISWKKLNIMELTVRNYDGKIMSILSSKIPHWMKHFLGLKVDAVTKLYLNFKLKNNQ